jgi:hypothetical protein
MSKNVKGRFHECYLLAHIEMSTGISKKHPKVKCPSLVILEIIDQRSEKKMYENHYQMIQLGFLPSEYPYKEQVC